MKAIWDLFYITFCNGDSEVHPRNIRSRQEVHGRKWLDSNVAKGRHILLSIISPPSCLTHFKCINMFQEITWVTSFQLVHGFCTRTKVLLMSPVKAGGCDDAYLRASDCKFDGLQLENKYFVHGFAWVTVYRKKTTEVRKFTVACLEAIIKASIITNQLSVVPHITSHFRIFFKTAAACNKLHQLTSADRQQLVWWSNNLIVFLLFSHFKCPELCNVYFPKTILCVSSLSVC